MNLKGVEKLAIMLSIQLCNSRNYWRSIWSSITAVVEFGMVLPHFVREPALGVVHAACPDQDVMIQVRNSASLLSSG